MKRVKEKDKLKVEERSTVKTSLFSKFSLHFRKHKSSHKIHIRLTKPKRYWPLIIPLVFAVCLVAQLPLLWLVASTVSVANTYPKATVLGDNIGNLNADQLDTKLAGMKREFEAKTITLVNAKDHWIFDASSLGVTFDTPTTKQSIFKLNKLSLIDKYRLSTGVISSIVVPTISVNSDMCVKALSVISISETQPVSATLYFDSAVKIKPDVPGTKFNPITTCQQLPKRMAANEFVSSVDYDIAAASLTASDLESKLSQIQTMVGKSLTLAGGGFSQTQTPEQLLALLDISKTGAEIKVGWLSDKLDEIVNNIADKVNTYDGGSGPGSCQYLSSSGGNWLDKTATKNIYTNLETNSARQYTLSISYHSPVMKTMTNVASGSSGTVYLTFDDGMTYANQIMNYAACYGVKVTFFEIGGNAAGEAAALQRAIAEGHAVQSHGHYHALYDYGARTLDWQINDMAQSIIDIQSITGVRPTYFRPPGGNRSANTYTAAATNGLTLILWSVTSQDAISGGLSSAQTCSNVVSRAFAGASVLMHSTHASTAAAFPCIVEGLAARGFNMQALR